MEETTADLSKLFGAALDTLRNNKQQINDLDGYNGNHGDNMTHNLSLITETLQKQADKEPSTALKQAASRLQTEGRGGTSQYYAQGLSQAADQFSGQQALSSTDVMTLVQSLLGSIPAEGGAPAPRSSATQEDMIASILGAATGSGTQAQGGSASVLESLLGMASGGGQAGTQAGQGDLLSGLLGGQGQAGSPQSDGFGLDDVMRGAQGYMAAKAAGGDNMTAITQAAMGALMGSNPLQSNSPRAAAGGLIAQTVLGALRRRR